MAKQGVDRLIALERGELMDGALAWRQYGEALATAGKKDAARQALTRSLDLFTKLFGVDNVETRITRKSLDRIKP